jgi:hypothetical protein
MVFRPLVVPRTGTSVIGVSDLPRDLSRQSAGDLRLTAAPLRRRPDSLEGGHQVADRLEHDVRMGEHRDVAPYRVFPKLGMTSRSQLTLALAADPPPSY